MIPGKMWGGTMKNALLMLGHLTSFFVHPLHLRGISAIMEIEKQGGDGLILYHGSNMTVTEPEIRRSLRGLDFGEGFYLSASEEQGQKFGFIVRNRAIK